MKVLNNTSDVAEIFIRGASSVVKLVDEEKIHNISWGLCTLDLKITAQDSQIIKGQKMKRRHNSPIFNLTAPIFCTSLMVHKNEQLLFFGRKISRPNQTSLGHFMFLQNVIFGLWLSRAGQQKGCWTPEAYQNDSQTVT